MQPGIYYHPQTPFAIVVVDGDGARYLVNSIATGWRDRRSFRGYDQALRTFRPPSVGIICARDAGVPDELLVAGVVKHVEEA